MNVPPIQPNKPQPTFGILKGYKKTPYGQYTWGEFKGHKIEIYDAYKYNQKLQYVSNSQTSNWVQSKLKYIQDGIIKIMRSKAK